MIIEMPELRWLVFTGEQAIGGFPPGTLKAVSGLAMFLVVVYAEARHGAFPAPAHAVRQSYYTNLSVFLLNEAALAVFPLSILRANAESWDELGLLCPVSNRVVRWALSLVLLDCMLYAWHRAIHAHDLLWEFHRTHHSDQCMNASTSFRIHAFELLCTALLKMLFMIVVGVDSALMLLNEGIATACVVLHHSNVRLPGERLLGLLFVVPSQHRVHHSALRSEHDRNYGAIFSVWDRWFGTLTVTEPANLGLAKLHEQTVVGVLWDGLPVGLKTAVGEWCAGALADRSNEALGRRICLRLRAIRAPSRRAGQHAEPDADRWCIARWVNRITPVASPKSE